MKQFLQSVLRKGIGSILLNILIFPSLMAQEEAPIVEFSFQTYCIANASQISRLPELYYQNGERFLPLPLRSNALGLKRTFKGTLPFAAYVQEINEEGEKTYRSVAVLNKTFPEGRQEHQVLLVKLETGKLSLDAISVDAELKAGRILVLNAGSKDIRIRAGEAETVIIGKGAARLVNYKHGADYRFRLLVASENENDGWELVHNAVVTQTREQALMLVVYPHSKKAYNVRFLPLDN